MKIKKGMLVKFKMSRDIRYEAWYEEIVNTGVEARVIDTKNSNIVYVETIQKGVERVNVIPSHFYAYRKEVERVSLYREYANSSCKFANLLI